MSDEEDRLSLDELNLWDDDGVYARKQRSIKTTSDLDFLSPTIPDDRVSLGSAGSSSSSMLSLTSVLDPIRLPLKPDVSVDPNGNNTFYLSEGYLYQSGHGRMKCQLTCLDSMDVPNNCGFHQQFYFLVHFKPCGPRCQGGFCPCLRRYSDY